MRRALLDRLFLGALLALIPSFATAPARAGVMAFTGVLEIQIAALDPIGISALASSASSPIPGIRITSPRSRSTPRSSLRRGCWCR